MPGAGRVLEVRGANVIHVFGVVCRQHVGRVERQATDIVGALEVLFGGVELHGFVEIQIAHVIDRQFFVEAEAVGEVEFHGGLGSLSGKGIRNEKSERVHPTKIVCAHSI